MNTKNIKKHLNAKLRDWLESIDDEKVKSTIKNNVVVTGGAMVSLLTGEPVHDYDIYLRTKEACVTVAEYYVNKWNQAHPEGKKASLIVEEDTTETKTIQVPIEIGYETKEVTVPVPGRVKVFIQSEGVVEETPTKEEVLGELPFPPVDKTDEEKALEEDAAEKTEEKPKYRPVFISSNAITLSDKVQVVIRFYGEVEELHKNYDFAHCTCSWTSWDNEVQLPTKALECIINKELYYIGSKYPLCSIIRTRKYLERGYHINAGQYVKMAFQLSELNLNDVKVLEDQLMGVDSGYFIFLIDALQKKAEKDENQLVDSAYVIELINRMF